MTFGHRGKNISGLQNGRDRGNRKLTVDSCRLTENNFSIQIDDLLRLLRIFAAKKEGEVEGAFTINDFLRQRK